MANLGKGHRPGIWRAYYWSTAEQKKVPVPAEVTRAWDGMSREQAQAALDAWVESQGIPRLRSRRRSLLDDDELPGLIKAYIERKTAQGRAGREAIQAVESNLRSYVTDYFVRSKGAKDVRDWWRHTDDFGLWLRATYPKLGVKTARKICLNLVAFGEFLARKHVINQPWLVELPVATVDERGMEETPLKRAWTPEEVLVVVERLERVDRRWAVGVLVGYFASLRPEEMMDLAKEDFMVGEKAKREAKTYQRFSEKGLGSNVSVSISRARSRRRSGDRLKTKNSYAAVNIFWSAAAKKLGEMMPKMPGGPLFGDTKREVLDEEWRTLVRPLMDDAFEYDLRRASGFYLARVRGCDPYLMEDHLRNTMNATLRYTRRPKEEREAPDAQNWGEAG